MTNASKSRAEPSSRDFSPDDGDHQGVIRASSGVIRGPVETSRLMMETIRASSGHHQGVIRASSGRHQGVINASSVSHQGVIRASSGVKSRPVATSRLMMETIRGHQWVIRRHQRSSGDFSPKCSPAPLVPMTSPSSGLPFGSRLMSWT
jgi:hypothetical protein